MEQYMSLALTLSALFGFVYGVLRFFRSRSALYARMIVMGIGCAMLGRLFETLQLVTMGELRGGFHVGTLGILGSFLFFISANYGQMDSLADDRSPGLRKYRWIAACAPLAVLALYAVYFRVAGFGEASIVTGILMLVTAQASYFHLKHLIIPDVEDGIIRSIRSYNLMGLIYAFLCTVEMTVSAVPAPAVLRYLVCAALCATLIAFIPVLAGGIKKWTT